MNVTLCSPRYVQTKESEDNLAEKKFQSKHALITSPKPRLPPNHVLIRVDNFGFSANNVTYEVLGEHPHYRYFDFHPAPDEKYGIVPVWGFGTVVQSTMTHGKHDIREGEKVYGYLAPTRYVLVPIEEASVGRHAFYVTRPHLPPDRRPYNQIIRCNADAQYTPTPEGEDLTMIYRPLFWTAYWCEDWLYSSKYRNGVSAVVISSASAKTAFCLAYVIGKRVKKGEMRGLKVVGLTSGRNVGFTTGLGLYDEVVEYGTVGEYFGVMKAKERWLYIDVAGNDEMNGKIKELLGQGLEAFIQLGYTNVSPGSQKAVLKEESSDEEAEKFFMPEWLEIRQKQLPVQEIIKRQNNAWAELMHDCKGWVKMERECGADKVLSAYERVLRDGFEPQKGYVWSMWDEPVVRAML